jgi:hypothetical protein
MSDMASASRAISAPKSANGRITNTARQRVRRPALAVGERPDATVRSRSGHVATAMTNAQVSAGMKCHSTQMQRAAKPITNVVRATVCGEGILLGNGLRSQTN